MKNQEIARIFYDMADMLELQGVTFKPNAYRRAAQNIESMSQDVAVLWREGRLGEIPGVGANMAEKIGEYLETGKVEAHEKLREEVPPGLVEIMGIRGVGPKTTKFLHQELGIQSVAELKQAASEGRIEKLKGLGPKKAENILRGIELKAAYEGRHPLGLVLPLAERVVAYLREHAPVQQISVGGSVRRQREMCGDIDILATAEDWKRVMEAFVTMPEVARVVQHGETKSIVWLRDGIQADLRVLNEASYGAALQYFTGNKEHNIQMRSLAIGQGLKLSEYGLFRDEERVAGRTEEEVYEALGLRYIEPELREDQGEIEAAREGRLPDLVTLDDLKGDLHVHTNWSDGHDPPEAMVRGATERGYAYVGLSDHSKAVRIAGGLTDEEILEQRDVIRDLRQEFRGIRILHGAEVDILDGGELDFADETLKELDYAVAAVHSRFNLPEAEMTERVVRAMEHPKVRVLAHPTGRQLGEREPVALDMDRVIQAAVETNSALEINAGISRLDLNGAHARRAKEGGAKLIVNTDSHATPSLDLMRFGVGQARRGWLEPADVVNTWDGDAFLAWIRA